MRADERLTMYESISLMTMLMTYNIFNENYPNLARNTGTAGWISQLIALALSFGLLALCLWLHRLGDGAGLLDICEAALGKVAARVIYAILIVFLMLYCAVCLNQAVEILQIYAYVGMSALTIDVLLMAAVAVFAIYSIKGMGKAVSVLLPLLLGGLVFILIVCAPQYDPAYLAPVLGRGAPSIALAGGQLLTGYAGVILIGIFAPAMGGRKQYKKAALISIAIAGALLVSSTLCFNMSRPYEVAGLLGSGLLGIAQDYYDAYFLQRLESIYIAVVIVAIIMLMGIIFLAVKKTWCKAFAIEKRHSAAIIVPLAVLVVCAGRAMGSDPALRYIVRRIIRRNGIVVLLLLLLLIVASLIRRAGAGKAAAAARRGAACLVCVVALAGLFSGCGHYNEPENEAHPIIMGYDKGENEKYRITFRVLMGEEDNGGSGQSGDENEIGSDVIVLEAPTFSAGLEIIQAVLPKDISLLHVSMMVLSEELARESIESFVESVMTYNDLKTSLLFVISRGSAYDFVSAETATFSSTLQNKLDLMLNPQKESAVYMVTPLWRVLYGVKSSYGDAVAAYGGVSQANYPQPRGEDEGPQDYIAKAPSTHEKGFLPGELPMESRNKMEVAGLAVFRDGKMVGALNTSECEMLMLMNNSVTDTFIVLPDPASPEDSYASLHTYRTEDVLYDSSMDEHGRVSMDITVTLECFVGIAQSAKSDYIGDMGQRMELAEALREYLEQRAAALVTKLQNDYRADVLQLGRYVAGHFLTIDEWEQYDWPERFPEAEINVKFIINM